MLITYYLRISENVSKIHIVRACEIFQSYLPKKEIKNL